MSANRDCARVRRDTGRVARCGGGRLLRAVGVFGICLLVGCGRESSGELPPADRGAHDSDGAPALVDGREPHHHGADGAGSTVDVPAGPPVAEPTEGEGAGSEVDDEDEPDGGGLEEGEDDDSDEAAEAGLEPFVLANAVEAGTYGRLASGDPVAAPVGPSGGTLRSGPVTLDIPSGAMPSQRVVTLTTVGAPDGLERPLPPSPTFGGIVGGPWDLEFRGTARLTVETGELFPPGTPLQLLAWQAGLLSFTIIARGTVDASGGRVTFPVTRLGRMTLRPEPVRVPSRQPDCTHPRLRLRHSEPVESEDATVGLVDRADRLARPDAFAWLTDFRRLSEAAFTGFKNEEVTNAPRTRRDERNHQDEDFLMDPNLAAATALLARLVQAEWVDPLSGAPAFELRVTEAYDSFIEHAARSTHYQGRAGDLTLDPVPGASLPERRRMYGRLAALAVCAGFDWVYFEDAFHVHASVLPTRIAWRVRGADGREQVRSRALGLPEEPGGVTPSGRPEGARSRTLDGARELKLVDGRLFWRYADGMLPPASVNAEDVRFAVEPAVRVDAGQGQVVDAWLVPHPRTEAAWRWFHGSPDGD